MASKLNDKNVAVTIDHESETISAFSAYGYDVVNRNFGFIEASREGTGRNAVAYFGQESLLQSCSLHYL
jgi:hypothetical protein